MAARPVRSLATQDGFGCGRVIGRTIREDFGNVSGGGRLASHFCLSSNR